MHAVVIENLEEYLSGSLTPAAQRDIEAHLKICDTCRRELADMQDISHLFGAVAAPLESGDGLEPAPGFYARVVARVGDRQPTPAFAGFFAMDLVFARRLVFASLLTLAALGSYLVSRETTYPGGPSPEVVMAQQDSPGFEAAQAHEAMLATLSTYEP